HNQGLAIAKAIGDRQWEARTLGNLGLAYYSLGDYKRAIDYHNQGLAIAKAIGDRQWEAASLNNIGLAQINSGNPKAAEGSLLKAIAVYESIRKDLGSNDALKVSIFETQANSYQLLQQALVAQNRTTEALLVAEQGRAKAFIELLAQRQQLSSTPVPLSIGQIQHIAKQQNATLVEYSIIWEDLYIWVVKPTGEVTFQKVDLKKMNLGLASEDARTAAATLAEGRGVANDVITGLVSKTRSTLRTTNSTASVDTTATVRPLNCRGNNCLQQMYQILIQPIAKQLPTNPDSRVIFIPHESLFLVPFAALQDSNHNFLIEKHTISIAPSIQVLELIHQQKLKSQSRQSAPQNSASVGIPGNALIVGNPTMPSVSPKIGEAPQPLDPLPGAQTEANMIAKLLNTQALTGNQATLAVVKQLLPTAKIIHLATHGLLDDLGEEGIPGKVALAPSKGDDGLLSANELLNLKLNAELVVLSACDTGRGRITGDGVIGLPRAFITAGVPSIVVSLWQVPDESTAFLMPEFYRQLQHNPDKAHALRETMLATMKKYPNPSYWAAFIFIGEAD
ncbi:MAG: CHAT domain-containing protein, partial [Rhizonema sp. PD38]|nr:CHAT domain-containing protein [Rhizonema sp. PD38]